MLLSSNINRPEHVWEKTWQWLSDVILFNQRSLANMQGMHYYLLFFRYMFKVVLSVYCFNNLITKKKVQSWFF